ncbi:ABC transporter ATP-binding protein [Bacillaceae bacterium]
MLSLQSVSKRIAGKTILQDVTFTVARGECFGIIGPNGAGKSSLLKIISGLSLPTGGEVRWNGRRLHSFSRKGLARIIAVVAQEGLSPYPVTVYEAVMQGRYPHLRWYEHERAEDIAVVERVLSQLGLSALREARLDALSGGERQRVAIARAMAQEPQLLLLDEPTTYLDIGQQVAMLTLIKRWQRECGLTVVSVMHDLNLAAQYCERLLLLNEGKAVKSGTVEEVLTREILAQVYGTEPEIVRHPKLHVPQVLLTAAGGKRSH